MAATALVFDIIAKDKASKAFQDVGDASDKTGGKLSKLGPVAVAAGAAVATGVAAGAVGLVKLGSSFDDAYDTIRVGTGATGEALKGLEDSFKNVVKDVPTDFGSASQAIADLNTRTGLTGPALEDLSKRTLELSRLTGSDLSATIASTTRLFGDWGVSTEDQADTLDKLFRASQATGIGVDELANKAVQFGAPLRAMGFSLDETAGLLGKFEKEGVNAELVMGAMRKGLATFAREGEDAPKALARLTDEIKNAKSPTEGTTKAMEVFGSKAGPDMAAAIREGRFDLGDLLSTISDGSETIMGAAADTEDFAEKWTKLKNRVFVGLEPAASGLFDAIGRGMDRLGPLFTQVGYGVDAFFAAFRDGDVTSDGFVGFMERAGVMAQRFAGVFQTSVVPALRDVWAFIETNVLPILSEVAEYIATRVVPVLADGFGKALAGLRDGLGFITQKIQENRPELEELFRGFKKVADFVVGNVLPVLGPVLGNVLRGAGVVIGFVIQGIAGFVNAGGDMVRVVRSIVDAIRGIPGSIGDVFGGLWQSFKSAVNRIVYAWNNLYFEIGGGSFFGLQVPRFRLDTPNIPYLARGGVVPATPGGRLVVVGEGGHDEAVVPLSGPYAPRGGVTVIVQGDVISEDRLLTKLRTGLQEQQRRGVRLGLSS